MANAASAKEIGKIVLQRGNAGPEVVALQAALAKALGEQAAIYPCLAAHATGRQKERTKAAPGQAGLGDAFNADTETALRAWQASVGLVADGIAGPRTLAALGLRRRAPLAVTVDAATVGKLFPCTRSSNIATNLPYVHAALAAFGLTDAGLVGVALATIRAETEGFTPIAELPSHFNTLPGQAPFSAYDGRLGNNEPGDGARFRGRGFIQLTGRDNYLRYGRLLDLPLVDNPDSACAPEIAACLLAAFLDAHREKLLAALAKGDLKAARKVVNGGSHGLERFADTFEKAEKLWVSTELITATPTAKSVVSLSDAFDAADLAGATLSAAAAASAPPLRRARSKAKSAAARSVSRREALDVGPDLADLRDHSYNPPPRSLPAVFPADEDIRVFIGSYTKAGLILDQGEEGACTGFGLACVINYLRWRATGMPTKLEPVSPRMLYSLARRFDEYEGENYSGSSCRGALKGWFHNGVCREVMWPYALGESALPAAGWDTDAAETTLGVYCRIDPRAITHMQAAILEVGALFVSSYTHSGWERIDTRTKIRTTPRTKSAKNATSGHADLPVIDYDGKPSRRGGHAYALVGFNRQGFVLQNSWGVGWGAGGFAVITYADWLAHAMDVWVAATGVPGVISGRLASSGRRAVTAAAAAQIDWWDEAAAYRHSIVLGNNGQIKRFEPQDGITQTLQHQACVLPDTWFRQPSQAKDSPKRLVLYAHGGLNSEGDAIARAQAMGRYFLGNGCYPIFLVWKSGLFESIGNILADKIAPGSTGRAGRAGRAGNWLTEKLSDPLVEKTIGRPFTRPLWSEMKENAELAADSGRGGDLLCEAIRALAATWGDRFELHLVGHSAGSILLGRLLDTLAQKNLQERVKSVHLYAPACTVAFANRHFAPQAAIMKNLHIDVLSDANERADNVVQLYQKSLLYFVSNALEADPRTPILGLANAFNTGCADWDTSAATTEALANWQQAVDVAGLTRRVTTHDEARFVTRRPSKDRDDRGQKSEAASHGGFDNNVDLISRTLETITGAPLALLVNDLVGF